MATRCTPPPPPSACGRSLPGPLAAEGGKPCQRSSETDETSNLEAWKIWMRSAAPAQVSEGHPTAPALLRLLSSGGQKTLPQCRARPSGAQSGTQSNASGGCQCPESRQARTRQERPKPNPISTSPTLSVCLLPVSSSRSRHKQSGRHLARIVGLEPVDRAGSEGAGGPGQVHFGHPNGCISALTSLTASSNTSCTCCTTSVGYCRPGCHRCKRSSARTPARKAFNALKPVETYKGLRTRRVALHLKTRESRTAAGVIRISGSNNAAWHDTLTSTSRKRDADILDALTLP